MSPPNVTVKVAGVPCFKASVCTVQNSLAIKITKKLHSEEVEVYQHEEKEIHE
ncbi:hypothetical protein [Endozoicomonas sp. GU-1]|uniref:hypothetical protein n=1 Tax=Endozoicomonas sp. GU-1 TaxID=3009078 RepID=UPI0022B521BA|nr:hypothetical protein [Endozoicomonas sp. GU-1]WBA85472.1 hypothetical protein O3276_19835 [Endozoicomonas sp. GU-1]